MFSNTKEIQKQSMDRTMVSGWICCLYDIWHDDIVTIKNKLMYRINDTYIVDDNDKDFIEEKLKVMSKGGYIGEY